MRSLLQMFYFLDRKCGLNIKVINFKENDNTFKFLRHVSTETAIFS